MNATTTEATNGTPAICQIAATALVIEFQPQKRGKSATLTAKVGGEVLQVESLDITRSTSRDRLICQTTMARKIATLASCGFTQHLPNQRPRHPQLFPLPIHGPRSAHHQLAVVVRPDRTKWYCITNRTTVNRLAAIAQSVDDLSASQSGMECHQSKIQLTRSSINSRIVGMATVSLTPEAAQQLEALNNPIQ